MAAQPLKPHHAARWASVCSALAIASALASPARAQTGNSYNAPDPTIRSGTLTFDRTSVPNQETYTIGSATAVLDFVPPAGSGTINFQTAGTTVIYTGSSNFTVLNRIVPTDTTRAIQFNGNVVSQVAGVRGGSVWFYSPGGIIVGPTASMNVGSLLLSTGDPTGGTGTISSTSSFTLSSAAGTGVSISPGATLSAQNTGSYIALVAPVVQQGGTVNINGAAAYVAAEQATLSFSAGLFDITVPTTGGSSANGGATLSHTGSTLFSDVGNAQRAYLVAVPKNTAITMLIASSGTLGFTTATAVNISQGAVVLTAGYNVQERTAGAGNPIGGQVNGGVAADIQLTSGKFNADTTAIAGRDLTFTPTSNAGFARDLTITGSRAVTLGGNGIALTIGRNLIESAPPPVTANASATMGGTTTLTALGNGSTTVLGNVRLDSGGGSFFPVLGATGAVTAGTALIDASSGDITVGGTTTVTAGTFSFSQSNAGTSGLNVAAGRTLTLTGAASVLAQATGYADNTSVGSTRGGNAKGGTAYAQVSGTLNAAGGLTVSATAVGGAQTGSAVGFGGAATGGTASVTVATGGSLTAGALSIDTTATGGASAGAGPGGAAIGGTTSFASGGTAAVQSMAITASATGGAKTGGNGDGGGATAGNALLSVTAGTSRTTGFVNLTANATGGSGAAVAGGLGGTAKAGDARIVAQGGGTLTVGLATAPTTVVLNSNAVGGAGNSLGGNAASLTASVSQGTGGSVTINGSVSMQGLGIGGASGVNGSAGGSGTGGDVRFVSNDGAISASGTVSLNASGTGGTVASTGGVGGQGKGGLVNIGSDAVSTSVGGAAGLVANGTGGAALASAGATGTGGTGTGGQALVGAIGAGTQSIARTANLSASGTGGASAAGTGGAGTGGTAQIFATKGLNSVTGAATTSATGTGGTGVTAGSGTGGQASFAADAGALRLLGGATADATGYSGSPSAGGSGTGGNASFFTYVGANGGGGRVDVTGAALALASGYGVPSSTNLNALGGAATGGNANVTANGGVITFNNGLTLYALGRSGYGANASQLTGLGGTAAIAADTGNVTVLGAVIGDASGSGAFNPTTGLTGGAAMGGSAFARVGSGYTLDLRSDVTLYANADSGVSSISGAASGTATAGTVSLTATGTLRVAGNVALNGVATAGAKIETAGTGGAATGGTTGLYAPGGTLSVAGTATLDSTGTGGDGNGTSANTGLANTTATGGAGQGGTAQVQATVGGSIQLTGAVNLQAGGTGGRSGSMAGLGGAGTGGYAQLNVNVGTITGSAQTHLFAGAFGGSGVTAGGLGAGGGGAANPTGGAGIIATNGTIDLTAGTGRPLIEAYGDGGQALSVTNTSGAIVAGGGAGGASQGGFIFVEAQSTSATVPGRLLAGNLTLYADSTGGNGAAGAPGQAGGIGGTAAGGQVAIYAAAGNGQLRVGDAQINVESTGGAGGAGGAANSTGAAGAGGAGGAAAAGFTSAIGTASGPDTTFNLGSATLGNIGVFATGMGGAGGNATAAGAAGGAGGEGDGGSSVLLSRGAPATVGAVNLNAAGRGGNGGTSVGGTRAAGGIARGGSVGILITNRASRTERGSLTAGALTGTADGVGGLGTGGATATGYAGITTLTVTNADARLAGIATTGGGVIDPTAPPTNLSVSGGTLAVGNTLSVSGGAPITLAIGTGGTLAAATLSLASTQGTLDGSTSTGLLQVGNSINLFARGDLRLPIAIGATLATTPAGGTSVTAGGAMTLGDVRTGAALSLQAGTGLSAGALESAGSTVTVYSAGATTLGTVRAGDGISLTSTAALTTADVTAGTLAGTTPGADPTFPGGTRPAFTNANVAIAAAGAITLGNVVAQDLDIDGTDLSSGPYGNIVTGNLTAEYIEVTSGGTARVGTVTTRDLFAGDVAAGNQYAVELGAVGNLSVGDIASSGLVALASQTGGVSAGNVTTPRSLLAFAATTIALQSATTGGGANDYLYLANVSMVPTTPAFAQVLTDNETTTFDPTILAGLAPVRVGGTIALAGATSTGNFVVAAAGGVQTGAISAPSRIAINSGTSIGTGALATAAALSLSSPGALSTGSITSGGSVTLAAGAALSTGAIVAGPATANDPARVTLSSVGALQAGAITGPGGVSILAQGGTARIDGAVTGPAIALTATDVTLSTQASLTATGAITISAQGGNGQPATVGGTAQGPGFTLDASELTRLRGNSITINTVSSSSTLNNAGALLVHDLTLNGAAAGASANLTGGTLTLSAAPGITVDGNVRLNNALTEDAVVFATAGGFRLATDTGSIGLFGADNAIGGRLAITAGDIVVGTAALLARATDYTSGTPSQSALALPATPPAQPQANGYVQANRIELTGTNAIVIQNSGSTTTPAGFSAGSGGMAVTSRAASGGLNLLIYGRAGTATGTATRDAITFSSGTQSTATLAGFSSVSAVNGCLLTAASCGSTAGGSSGNQGYFGGDTLTTATTIVSPAFVGIVDGALAADSSDAVDSAVVSNFARVSLIDAAALVTDALVEEPVTGGGNASLWIGGDDALADSVTPATPDDPKKDRSPPPAPHPGDRK